MNKSECEILNKRLGYIEDTLTCGDKHKKDLLVEFVCLVNDKLGRFD